MDYSIKHTYTHTHQQHPLLVDSITASKEDLLALKTMLQSKLKQVQADERKMKIDLSELKAKIAQDLKKVETRLKSK